MSFAHITTVFLQKKTRGEVALVLRIPKSDRQRYNGKYIDVFIARTEVLLTAYPSLKIEGITKLFLLLKKMLRDNRKERPDVGDAYSSLLEIGGEECWLYGACCKVGRGS